MSFGNNVDVTVNLKRSNDQSRDSSALTAALRIECKELAELIDSFTKHRAIDQYIARNEATDKATSYAH